MDSGIEKLPCIPGKGGTEEKGRGSALLGAGDLFPSNPQVVHAREEYTPYLYVHAQPSLLPTWRGDQNPTKQRRDNNPPSAPLRSPSPGLRNRSTGVRKQRRQSSSGKEEF